MNDSRARRRRSRFADGESYVKYFKERVYATFTGLAIVLVVSVSDHPSSATALVSLLLGVVGIIAAGFVSDVIAHLAVHQGLPNRIEWGLLVRIAGGGLSTLVAPGIVLGLAVVGVFSDAGALDAARWIYIVTLAVIGWLVVRRARLTWWKQAIVLAVLVVFGLGVIWVQSLAHGLGEH